MNEACQLYLKDIRQDQEGTWFFSINTDADDKRLKNRTTEREVPIHPQFIKLGLLNYVNSVRVPSNQRLFPELNYREADAFGRSISSWFTKYRKHIGIIEKSKVFHSFRHTVAIFFKQIDVAEVIVATIVGHENSNITYGRYGKKYSP